MDTATARELVVRASMVKPFFDGGREQMEQAGRDFDAYLSDVKAEARLAFQQRVAAMCRLLVGSGDMTPMGARQIERLYQEQP